MKKQIFVAVIATAISMPSMADFFGVYAGIDYRTTVSKHDNIAGDFQDTNNLSGYIALEHFIPLIPNAKLKYSNLNAEYSDSLGGTDESTSSTTNAIAYYEILDNPLVELDLGLAYTRFDALSGQTSNLAQAYGAAKVHIPGVGMYVFTEVIAGTIGDDDATDAEIGIAYTLNPDSLLVNISVRAGYRYQETLFNENTQENRGLFAGLEAHF